MPTEVILPKVDMDMATGQISRWFAEEGAKVKKGDVLFEIETDKAAMEIDAPASGTLRNVTGKERVDIPVGEPVAWIYADDEVYAPISPLRGEMPAKPTEGGAVPSTSYSVAPPSGLPAISSTRGEISQSQGPARATPLARRLAREANLDLSAIAGSGPRGRVVRADVEAAAAAKDAAASAQPAAEIPAGAPSAPAPAPKPMSDDQVLKLFAEGSYELAPHDNMRKTIARRLVEAKSTIPHFYLTL
ncbi:E3 binding domain-containing protein, partial [Mesorhizobium sp. B2-8-3]|uniref:E3 binding domain-containing protein n=1 Tax=Mesorhizobium sp. B2-8-3 TaxID=2589905 RepID=UPI00112E3C7C